VTVCSWFVVVAKATHKLLVILKDACLSTYAHSTPSGLVIIIIGFIKVIILRSELLRFIFNAFGVEA
jgi:hypothetical protein